MCARVRGAAALSVAAMVWTCVVQGAAPLVDVQIVGNQTTISGQSIAELPRSCPGGYVALSGLVTPSDLESVQILGRQGLHGSTIPPIVDGVYAAPTGITFTVRNTSTAAVIADTAVVCGKFQAGYATSLAVANHTLQAGERRVVNAACPSGQVATGGGYAWDGGPVVWDAPWGLFPGIPGGYAGVPDGTHPAPGGWEFDAVNLSGSARTIRVSANCYQLPEARTVVGSAWLAPGQAAFRGLAIANDLRILGHGVHGGTEGLVRGGASWTLSAGLNFTRPPSTLSARGGGFSGGFLRDLRAPGSMGSPQQVRIGLVVEPYTDEPPPKVETVKVVEFYHATKKFYFSTAFQWELTIRTPDVMWAGPGPTRASAPMRSAAAARSAVSP